MLESSRKPSWWITAKTQAARVAEKEPLGAWYYDDDDAPYPGRGAARHSRVSMSSGHAKATSAAAARDQARREAGTDDDRPSPYDDLPYPGYTPDGPRQFTLDVEAYYRLGLDPLLGIRCKCGLTITDTTIYACTFDRWHGPEFFCALCMPDEWRWVIL